MRPNKFWTGIFVLFFQVVRGLCRTLCCLVPLYLPHWNTGSRLLEWWLAESSMATVGKVLKPLYTFGTEKKKKSNKSVKSLTQLVVVVARDDGRKNTLFAQVVCSQMPWIRDLSWGLFFNSNIQVRNYAFLKNYVTSEGAVSHKVLYYRSSPLLVSSKYLC